jgi:hypothetical protein
MAINSIPNKCSSLPLINIVCINYSKKRAMCSKHGGIMKAIFKNCLFVVLFVTAAFGIAWACTECTEVAKESIPPKYVNKSVKSLPSGITIWDAQEALDALKGGAKILWVDTRPGSFFSSGTVIGAVNLVYDQNDKKAPGEINMTKELLVEKMQQAGSQKVAFFCQGPKCHRSYNAALKAIKSYGLQPTQVIWFRAGYPDLLDYIQNNALLKKRITKYLQGTVVQ